MEKSFSTCQRTFQMRVTVTMTMLLPETSESKFGIRSSFRTLFQKFRTLLIRVPKIRNKFQILTQLFCACMSQECMHNHTFLKLADFVDLVVCGENGWLRV